MLRDLVAKAPAGTGTNISGALEKIRKSLKKRTVIFLISDFLEPRERWSKNLRMLARKHDLVMISVADPAEKNLGISGIWNVSDAENFSAGTIFSSKKFRERFAENSLRERAELEKEAAKANAGFISLECGEDFVLALKKFFERRK